MKAALLAAASSSAAAYAQFDEWLDQTAFIGTAEQAESPNGEPAVKIRFFKVLWDKNSRSARSMV